MTARIMLSSERVTRNLLIGIQDSNCCFKYSVQYSGDFSGKKRNSAFFGENINEY